MANLCVVKLCNADAGEDNRLAAEYRRELSERMEEEFPDD